MTELIREAMNTGLTRGAGTRKNRSASVIDMSRFGPVVIWPSCSTSTETVGLLGTGAQDSHLDFHTAPELSVGYCDPCLL